MKNTAIYYITVYTLATVLTGCEGRSQDYSSPDRAAVGEDGYFGENVTKIVYPAQNWTAGESLWFYNTSQGSDLMSYDIFINLEQSDSTDLFRSNANMFKYRYLPQRPTEPDNPKGLPVGWVKNTYQGKDYVGFTCAACHTAQLNYNGTGIRVDGGPAMADMEWMLEDLEKALWATINQREKFNRLAANILKDKAQDADERRELETALQIQLTKDALFIEKYNVVNRPMHGQRDKQEYVAYGYGRLDAFGRIYNQIFAKLSPQQDFRATPANAPVSYPALWDTPQHDFVQWNGIGANNRPLGLGALGRNTGEVLGVFATFDIQKKAWYDPTRVFGDEKFPSSAQTLNLIALERSLRSLWSPAWPELAEAGVLPPIDGAIVEKGQTVYLKDGMAERGRRVYLKYECSSCHSEEAPAGVEWRKLDGRKMTAKFVSLDVIGTDGSMARNAIEYCGKNNGVLKDIQFYTKGCGGRAGDVRGIEGLEHVTQGVVADGFIRSVVLSPWHFVRHVQDYGFSYDKTTPVVDGRSTCEPGAEGCDIKIWTESPQLRAYKGRTLNGIWATAPYLHNGSVPNLYELFLPTCDQVPNGRPGDNCRSVTFTVGSLEFDPKKVGFEQDRQGRPGSPPFPVFDTRKPGNSNAGHEYPDPAIPMSPDERWALVEYLKTL